MTEDRPEYDQQPTPARPPIELTAVRCPKCGRMLAKVLLTPGSIIEIQCKSCGAFLYREAA